MRFGLMNAPLTLQRTLDILLSGLQLNYRLLYIADVITFFKSFEEHLEPVKPILKVLQDAGVFLTMKNATNPGHGEVSRPCDPHGNLFN